VGEVADAPILAVCAGLPRIVIPTGSHVIEQGAKRGALFVLVEGAVIIDSDNIPVAEISEPGAIFGEMSSLLDRPASTTVTATVDTTFLFAERGAAYLAATPEAAIEVARALAERLEQLTSYLSDTKLQFAEFGGHVALMDDVMKALIHDKLPVVRPGSVRMPETEY
jgi:CRP-like cAMP-binding protein